MSYNNPLNSMDPLGLRPSEPLDVELISHTEGVEECIEEMKGKVGGVVGCVSADEAQHGPPPSPSANAQSLAEKLLHHARVTFDGDNIRESFRQIAEDGTARLVDAYDPSRKRVPVSVRLLETLLSLADDGGIEITSLTTCDCHAGGRDGTYTSTHYKGRGVDVWRDDSEATSHVARGLVDRRSEIGIDELIFDPMPGGTYTLKGGSKNTYSSETLREHQNHLHFSTLQ